VGATLSNPLLRRANADIHAIEDEVRQLAPGVKTFEDWDDVYTGTVGAGLEKTVDIMGVPTGVGVFIAYAKGDVNTRENNLDTVLGAPLDYDFKQTYELTRFEINVSPEIFKTENWRGALGAYLSYNLFKSDSELNSSIAAFGINRNATMDFEDDAIGYGIGLELEVKLQKLASFLKNWSLMTTARYDWTTFKDDAEIRDTTSTTFGSQTEVYKLQTEVDTTGEAFGILLRYAF
jgi:hypothetical protein